MSLNIAADPYPLAVVERSCSERAVVKRDWDFYEIQRQIRI